MSTRTPAARRSASRAPSSAPAAVAAETARPDRKQAILLAAEKLFARHGYHVVTIRQIAEEAGVPLALVGYYHGQKHELFHAIFAHWGHAIEARLAGLAAVDIDPGDARTLPRIIEAFTAPVLALRASAEGEYYALLVARELYHATEEADRVLRAYFDPLAEAYIDALHAALPHATRGEAAWGYQFALGALLHHLNDSRIERLSRGENTRTDPAVAPMLVSFIVGRAARRAAAPEGGEDFAREERLQETEGMTSSSCRRGAGIRRRAVAEPWHAPRGRGVQAAGRRAVVQGDLEQLPAEALGPLRESGAPTKKATW